jgi:hypothetical protein
MARREAHDVELERIDPHVLEVVVVVRFSGALPVHFRGRE